MNTTNLYGVLYTPGFEAMRRLQEQFNNSALAITMRNLQIPWMP